MAMLLLITSTRSKVQATMQESMHPPLLYSVLHTSIYMHGGEVAMQIEL